MAVRSRSARWPVGVLVATLALGLLLSGSSDRAAAAARGPFAGWTTAFRDNFTGAAGAPLDHSWVYDVGTGYPGGAPQWGTGEVETASNSTADVHLDGQGHLAITPIRGATAGGHRDGSRRDGPTSRRRSVARWR